MRCSEFLVAGMEPTQPTHPAEPADVPAPPPVVKRQNPKWVGPIMAFLLPGSAHFLSGQRRTGVLLYFAVFSIWISLYLMSVPDMRFFYVAVGLFVASMLFFIGVLISSYR